MPVRNHTLKLSIHSIDDITRCVNLASLLELAGWPKPGNVHRTKGFGNTSFEHFLAGITAIQPCFKKLCERCFKTSYNISIDFGSISLGLFYRNAANEMMKWQSGGNVLLGHILILAPLVAATTVCLKTNLINFDNFKHHLIKVIDGSTAEDTINLYKAIKSCNPGGLGTVEKYDITNNNSIKEIQRDNINLKKIFTLSKEYDLISSEYSTGFSIILNEGLPYFIEQISQFQNPNIATVNTFLKILSVHLDTLIIRKSGIEAAFYVSESAKRILQKGGISTDEGLELTLKLDEELQKKEGNLNPGTTADLLAGTIFCALIFGFKL
ncbi:MAG: triphosphoribosyl-dephospho-CoA synthase [Candidatus Thorarchaeota archaeon]